jgi:hypothetical protein
MTATNANYPPGSIFVSSWGYDQTNVNFYQAIRRIGKTMLEIRPIASATRGETGGPSEHVVPHINRFTGEPERRRVGADGSIAVPYYKHADPWDGRPKRRTGAMYGH